MSRGLEAIILQCLERAPENRYQTATELATELYTRGLADFLSVLDAQRDQLAAEDALAQSDTAVTTASRSARFWSRSFWRRCIF